jgi:recombination protein RecA
MTDYADVLDALGGDEATETPKKKKAGSWQAALQAQRKKWAKYSGLPEFTGAIPSGSLALDIALGVGGFGKGGIIRLAGPFGSGKTTLMEVCAAQHIERGEPVLWIDTESAVKRKQAAWNGLDIDSELFHYVSSQARDAALSMEVATQIVEGFMLACKGQVTPLVIIDSFSNLPTEDQLQGKIDDAMVASQARIASRWMRIAHVVVKETNGVVLLSEQMTANFGAGFGQPSLIPSSPNKVKYNAQTAIELSKVKQLARDKGDNHIPGYIIGFSITKNRFDVPGRTGQFVLKFDDHVGIDRAGEVVALGVAAGILSKAGAWYEGVSTDPDLRFQGAEAAADYLRRHPDRMAELAEEIRNIFSQDVEAPLPEVVDD